MRHVYIQYLIRWNGREPFFQKGIEKRSVFCAGDVDSVTRGQTSCYGTFIRHQSDDELWLWQGHADEVVEFSAEIIFKFIEQVPAEEEAGEGMEVEVESAIDQSNFRGRA